MHKNDQTLESTFEAISRFGIVAAMSRNRIIGINGKLPWSISEDRATFKTLTRDKILIIGRRTYEEDKNECHIDHVKSCIVVSKTANEALGSELVRVARSFPEALGMAHDLVGETDGTSIDCWVAGGERIYEEALKHPSVQEVHLTVVDLDVDPTKYETDEKLDHIAFFPRKYTWDRKFLEASKTTCNTTDLTYTQFVYKRKKR